MTGRLRTASTTANPADFERLVAVGLELAD
jgi:hypothetical protein